MSEISPPTCTDDDVTDMLRDMIKLTHRYRADPEGYVCSVDDEDGAMKRIEIPDPKRPILLYSAKITDSNVHLLNPMAEGVGPTSASMWFYRAQRLALNSRMTTLLTCLVHAALRQQEAANAKKKPGKQATSADLPSNISRILIARVGKTEKTVVQEVDAEVLNEIDRLVGSVPAWTDELIQPIYNRTQLITRATIPLIDGSDPDWPNADSKVRKKTLAIFRALLCAILDVEEGPIEKFDVAAAENTPPKFQSFMSVLFNIYRTMAPAFAFVDQNGAFSPDLETLQRHIGMMPAYFRIARWMRSPSAPAAPKQQQGLNVGAVPPAMPHVPAGTSYVPGPIGVPRVQQQQVYTTDNTVPGAVYANGSQGHRVPVANVPTPGGAFNHNQQPGVISLRTSHGAQNGLINLGGGAQFGTPISVGQIGSSANLGLQPGSPLPF